MACMAQGGEVRRMIDEKLLIEIMQWKMREAGTSDWNRCLDEVEKFIKEFPQVGGWIPVSERLPEEGYGVLATVNGKHNNTTFIDALEIAEYDSDEGWIIEGYLDWINPDVTAWQPLPEPYKESEEE